MSRDASTALSVPWSAKRPSGSSVVAMPMACRKARASAISSVLTHVSRSVVHRYMIARAASSKGRELFIGVIVCASRSTKRARPSRRGATEIQTADHDGNHGRMRKQQPIQTEVRGAGPASTFSATPITRSVSRHGR